MMDMLNDPSMKEIVDGFCEESIGLFSELEEALEALEDDPSDTAQLETFGQVIDRVMGAAKSIGAQDIANFCELGKVIGYKSSQSNDPALVEVVTAVLFDAVDLLNKMVKGIKDGNTDQTMKNLSPTAFITRLRWLSDKFKDIERASCAIDETAETDLDQSSIDDLLSNLGL